MKNTIVIITGILILSQAPKIGAVTMSYDEGTPCSYSPNNKHAERYLNSVAGNFGQSRGSGVASQSSALTVAASPSKQAGYSKSGPSQDRQINKVVPQTTQRADNKRSQIKGGEAIGAHVGFILGAAAFLALFPEAAWALLTLSVSVGAFVLAGTMLGVVVGHLVGSLRTKG